MNTHMKENSRKSICLELRDLPKVSGNQFYAGRHWSFRKKMKDLYKIILSNCPSFEGGQYMVSYEFEFKKNPLDASNTIGMLKMVEDILFPNDSYKVVLGLFMSSRKGREDVLRIRVDFVD